MISSTVLVLTAGRLSDLFGRKRAYLGGFVVFALASLGAGFSGDATQLILWRVLQGIGSLAGLSRHETARAGVAYGIAGMAVALVATVVLAARVAHGRRRSRSSPSRWSSAAASGSGARGSSR